MTQIKDYHRAKDPGMVQTAQGPVRQIAKAAYLFGILMLLFTVIGLLKSCSG